MPAIDTLESLRIHYAKDYFDVYNFDNGNVCDNPLKPFTVFADDENKPKPFFGPYVFNAVIMTAPWVTDTGWDTAAVDKCKEIITNSFVSFSRFELHFFIDQDAEDITNPANADALAAAEALFGELGSSMGEFGINYWGLMSLDDIKTQIVDLLTTFHEEI